MSTTTFWNQIRKISSRKISLPITALRHDQALEIDPKKIVNILASHYEDVTSNYNLSSNSNKTTNSSVASSPTENTEPYNGTIGKHELISAIQNTRKSSPG